MAAIAVVLIAVIGAVFPFYRPATSPVSATRIFAAGQKYAHDLRAQGLPVPATVSLPDLLANGLLTRADVSDFADKEVTVSLTADKMHPNEILMRVRMQDGSQIVALADGSVQELPR